MLKKTCTTCKDGFTISDEELALYKKLDFEPIDLCFECDHKRRLYFRNERSLYTRKCDATGEKIISIYSEDKPYKVYKNDYWYGDKWDALEYGRDFDFGPKVRPFFEQLKELQLEVPRIALFNARGVNSDYCNMTIGNKNCYLLFGGDFNEDSMYGTLCMHNLKIFDCDYSNKNQFCYMISDCFDSYGCRFAFDCSNCSDSYFVSDCIGCSECILCTNLVKKSYCIKNVQYSKEEYLSKKEEFINGSYSQQEKNWQDFLRLREERIVKYSHIVQCQNSDGDYLKNCKNCHNSYDVSDSEDIRNVIYASKTKDCFNSTLIGDNSEVLYNNMSCVDAHFTRFSFFTINSSNIDYCDMTIGSQNLFGCVGMRRKKYCIFNKQYSKEEYEDLRNRIIEHMKQTGEWGDFLPKDLSCFEYNETTAHRYYPMQKEKAERQGFKWRDKTENTYNPQSGEVSDNIGDVPDSICSEILACTDCGKNFKILEAEFRFYKKMNIPIPRKCSDCRHEMRMSLRNPRKLSPGMCEKCDTKFKTAYLPDRPEKLYCEKCYLDSIV